MPHRQHPQGCATAMDNDGVNSRTLCSYTFLRVLDGDRAASKNRPSKSNCRNERWGSFRGSFPAIQLTHKYGAFRAPNRDGVLQYGIFDDVLNVHVDRVDEPLPVSSCSLSDTGFQFWTIAARQPLLEGCQNADFTAPIEPGIGTRRAGIT